VQVNIHKIAQIGVIFVEKEPKSFLIALCHATINKLLFIIPFVTHREKQTVKNSKLIPFTTGHQTWQLLPVFRTAVEKLLFNKPVAWLRGYPAFSVS
jgi:hypothetical protein